MRSVVAVNDGGTVLDIAIDAPISGLISMWNPCLSGTISARGYVMIVKVWPYFRISLSFEVSDPAFLIIVQ